MEEYHNLIKTVLEEGNYRPNRTAIDTISRFGLQYRLSLKDGFPLVTTKDLSGSRWESLIHEFLWYLSGEEHIRTLREHTGIWDAWADDDGKLDTAYGRFWRRYPVPDENSQLPGEAWPQNIGTETDSLEDFNWIKEEDGTLVIDQLRYIIDTLNGDNPNKSPKSRRLVVNAWHPANATVSTLPPCHYSFVFNVQGENQLNCHLTQRSGDIALGVPFNIAAYSLLTHCIANETGYEVGEFSHSIIDAHIYCGVDERAEWYAENLSEVQEKVRNASRKEEYRAIGSWIEQIAPSETEDGNDHVPRLLNQLSRQPRPKPRIEISDKPIDDLEFDDINLIKYNPHPPIKFNVAE